MPAIARNGDPCGGTIIATALNTLVNGLRIARIGDAITSHGTGLHAVATLVTGSATVFAEGISVCRVGDFADCGHTISAGSLDSFAE